MNETSTVAAVPQRGTGHRVALFASIIMATFVALVIAGAIHEVLMYMLYLGALAVLVHAGTKVGYRARYWLFLFVPIWSFVYASTVLWRVTALPARYWPERT